MSFLLPIWLWAAAAAAIPITIHLLSRGRGQVVRVGTVRFLPRAESHRLRRLRPSGPLRLLLRCALIASVAIALAAPRWWSPAAPRPGESWVLVDPALLAARSRLQAGAPEAFRRIDEAAGTPGILLTDGLPDWESAGDVIEVPDDSIDLWSLIAEAARRVPPEAALTVFVLDRAEAFKGVRPDLGRTFEWLAVPDPDPNRWIQRVITTPDGVRATIGTSDATGTVFESHRLPTGVDADAALRLSTSEQGPGIDLQHGGTDPRDDRTSLPPESPPLSVIVRGADIDSPEATAIRNAVEAIAEHSGRSLVSGENPTVPGDDAMEPDLLVDLGGETTAGTAAVHLVTGSGAGTPCRQSAYLAGLPDPWVEIRRCGENDVDPSLWRDRWGRPLLSVEPGPDPKSVVARWNGRLDPAWSSLSDAGLPHLLLSLVDPDDGHRNGSVLGVSDRRAAGERQSRPMSSSRPAPSTPSPLPERLAWVAAALLFLIDRLLVGRTA